MTSILSQEKLVFDATNSNEFISKSKNIFPNFYRISRICIKFGIPWKKRRAPEGISFWDYGVEMAGLVTCIKSPLVEHSWAVYMLKGPKDCLNLHGSICVILFVHCEIKSARKILF